MLNIAPFSEKQLQEIEAETLTRFKLVFHLDTLEKCEQFKAWYEKANEPGWSLSETFWWTIVEPGWQPQLIEIVWERLIKEIGIDHDEEFEYLQDVQEKAQRKAVETIGLFSYDDLE